MRRTARHERVILVALIAMVVVPVLGAGIRLAAEGWFPTFDDAVIANRSFDVLTRHTPLVGQFSLAGSQGPPTHSPGPMLFWYSALSARGPVWAIPAVRVGRQRRLLRRGRSSWPAGAAASGSRRWWRWAASPWSARSAR